MLSHFVNIQYCYNYLVNQISIGLLLYAHIPAALLAIILGLYVLYKTRNLEGVTLSFVCMGFSIWCFLSLATWFSFLGSGSTMFTWALTDLISLIFFFFSYYFLYTFTTKQDLPTWQKIVCIAIILPTAIWTFFGSSLLAFDANTCEAIENGLITSYPYYVEGFFIIVIIIFIINQYIKNKGKTDRREALFVGIGVSIFLFFFFLATFITSLLVDYNIWQNAYDIEIYGLFGMPILLAFLVYTIVKFKAFDIKLLGTQALVWSLIIVIGAEFFFIQSNVNRILTAITLIISVWIGLAIIRSVKKEVAQKERIQRLAESLESSNSKLEEANDKLKELDQMKSEFVSLATHQIRGPLAAIKGYVSLMTEGDYGQVPENFVEPLSTIFKSTDSLSTMVTDFLDVSRIDLGQMKYEFSDFDFRDLANEVIKELSPNIKARGLELRIKITDNPCPIKADRTKLKQVLNNLVDNSSKYTKQGWMEISVENKGGKILFAVKDTGVGISPKTMEALFQRFSRAKDANKTNILGTGLGLYVAKKMTEANNGRVWAESEGEGKGAQFYVELPVKLK